VLFYCKYGNYFPNDYANAIYVVSKLSEAIL